MHFFSYTKKKIGKHLGYFLGFFCYGIMNIHNNILVNDAQNKLREKHT
jgi:hypothetical protein